MTEMVRGVDYSPGCGVETCPCQRKGSVCEEFMGVWEEYPLKEVAFCPRCGWHFIHHPQKKETP